jgi:hypothetical protein
MIFKRVDLPAPLGPTIATNSPAANSAVIDWTTSVEVYPKDNSFSAITVISLFPLPKVLPQTNLIIE